MSRIRLVLSMVFGAVLLTMTAASRETSSALAAPSASHVSLRATPVRSDTPTVAVARSDEWSLDGEVEHMAMATSGVLYFTGAFTKIGPVAGSGSVIRHGAAALDTRTGLVTGWNPRPNATARGLAVSPSGRVVYVVGDFTRIGGKKRIRVAALDARTGAATNWRPVRVGINSNDGVAIAMSHE